MDSEERSMLLCISQFQAPTPPGNPPPLGIFWGSQSPAPGQKFSAKGPWDKKAPAPEEYFGRSSQPFLLIGVEILEFWRNQTLKRIGRLSNYSLVMPSSFSLSTILKSFKVSPNFETYFVTRVIDGKISSLKLKSASYGINWQLGSDDDI